jgi:3-isopropylmalate/(R)-2-methylmalate dehydratase small subunit
MLVFQGRVWKFGDHVSTDIIMPAFTLYGHMAEELRPQYCMAAVRPEFASEAKPGDIVVAGRNFGCGSIRPPSNLQSLGIGCLLADSFSRPFLRYCLNVGFPALAHPTISAFFDDGEAAEVDFDRAQIRNLTQETILAVEPLPDLWRRILDAGGLMETLRT